jgi:hypothetical protein
MKRYSLVRLFLSLLEDNDVVVVSGEKLGEQAFKYDKEGRFYIDCVGTAISVALGIANNTDKRVFVLCNDGDFLRDIGAAAQTAVSVCRNIFIVIFDEGRYSDDGGSPTIFRTVTSIKGFLFNLGFGVNDYSDFFYKKGPLKELKLILDRSTGPTAIIIKVETKGSKKFNKISYSKVELRNRINKFVRDSSLGTSLYIMREM